MERLDQLVREFRDTHQQAIRVEIRGHGGSAFLHGDVQPPEEMEHLICVILQHFRAALNYLAYQLVILDTGRNPPLRATRIEFPIFTNPALFEKQAWIKELSAGHQAALRELQPYDGRNESLRILYELDKINRHRLLHSAVVYTAPAHHDVKVVGGTLKSMEIIYDGPFKDGAEVLRFEVEGPPGPVEVYPQVALYICIAHPLANSRQAVGVLMDIGKTIVGICDTLGKEFAEE